MVTHQGFLKQSYLRDFGRDGDPEEVHGHVHPGHHEDEQAVPRVPVRAQALLQEDGFGLLFFLKVILTHYSRCALLTRATALSVRKPEARLPMKPPTSRALM